MAGLTGSSARRYAEALHQIAVSENAVPAFGESLERSELVSLVRGSYDLVVAKLPKSRRPGAERKPTAGARVASSRRRAAKKRRNG